MTACYYSIKQRVSGWATQLVAKWPNKQLAGSDLFVFIPFPLLPSREEKLSLFFFSSCLWAGGRTAIDRYGSIIFLLLWGTFASVIYWWLTMYGPVFLRSVRSSWSTCAWWLLPLSSPRRKSVKWSGCGWNGRATVPRRHWPVLRRAKRLPAIVKLSSTLPICGAEIRGDSSDDTAPIAVAKGSNVLKNSRGEGLRLQRLILVSRKGRWGKQLTSGW